MYRIFSGKFTEIVLTLKRRLWSADSGRRNRRRSNSSDSKESRDDRLNSPKSGISCFCFFTCIQATFRSQRRRFNVTNISVNFPSNLRKISVNIFSTTDGQTDGRMDGRMGDGRADGHGRKNLGKVMTSISDQQTLKLELFSATFGYFPYRRRRFPGGVAGGAGKKCLP